MALKDDIALLTGVPLFSDLDEDTLRLIAFGAERQKVLKGQTLFREGTNGDCAYVVAGGSFDLTRKSRDGRIELGIAEPGTLLGEIAMISPVERRMTAIAAVESAVMRINRPLFHRMLEEYPEIGQMVLERVRANFANLLNDLAALESQFRP